MKLKYFLTSAYEHLRESIGENLSNYTNENPWVETCVDGCFDADTNIDVSMRELIISPKPANDLENVKILYSSLKGLTTEQAMDGRLWAHLAHVEYWKYMRARWGVDSDNIAEGDTEDSTDKNKNLERRIRDRYFLAASDSNGNSRSLIRNGIARLWWFGHLTYDENEADHFVLTKTLLDYQDIQSSLLERTFGKNNDVLRICLRVLAEHMQEIRDRKGRSVIQGLGKYINLLAGTCFLDTMDKSALKEKITAFITRKIQE